MLVDGALQVVAMSAFKAAVDAATYANGGTNQQACIHVAQQLLASASSTGKQKNICLLYTSRCV